MVSETITENELLANIHATYFYNMEKKAAAAEANTTSYKQRKPMITKKHLFCLGTNSL